MLILLDIDGVMVPANAWKRPALHGDGFPLFSQPAVQSLQTILDATHADIVLTTSHKSNFSVQQWIDIFHTRGIAVSGLQVLPDNVHHLGRKEEIMNWFVLHYYLDHFVIIDDDKSLNDLPPVLKSRLIQPSGAIGLTRALAQQAIELLNSEMPLVNA